MPVTSFHSNRGGGAAAAWATTRRAFVCSSGSDDREPALGCTVAFIKRLCLRAEPFSTSLLSPTITY